MTIQELYDYAKKNNIVDYELEAQYADDGGFYYGSRSIYLDDIEIKDNIKSVII